MIEWTPSAKAELGRYFNRVRPSLTTSGADAAEVEDDLRRHIDEEAASTRLNAVTEDDVRRILNRIGALETCSDDPLPPAGSDTRQPQAPAHKHPLRLVLLVFGVVLPTLTLAIELVTHMCAGAFFDPLPTWGHVLLVASVPLANFLVWRAARAGDLSRLKTLAWANAFALGIVTFYALLFLPLLAPAFFAILFFGWGLLPMSPLFAFVATGRLRHHLRRLESAEHPARLPGLGSGAAIGFATMLALQLPTSLTEIGLHVAASDSGRTSARGVRMLRNLGDEQALLRACYGRTRWAANLDFISWLFTDGHPVSVADARNIYYRVTGQAFNSLPPPKIFTARGQWNVLEEEFTWDVDQGGDAVAGRVKGLSLVKSRQDAQIDAGAALAYSEWTLEFKNVSPLQREARVQVRLPPGGVVSRLTLWINGEEREAAFGGRTEVREAYQKVVAQRRDPVLVTTSGPDRVLMQCFPVPPNGGSMKVRLGITAPLMLSGPGEAAFQWPCFLERNFTIADDLRHSVWVDAKEFLGVPGGQLKVERSPSGGETVRGNLTERDLGDPQNSVLVHRSSTNAPAWVMDSRGENRRIIRQSIVPRDPVRPTRVIFVVDGSSGMGDHFPAISAALTNLPDGLEFGMLIAYNETDSSTPAVRPANADNRRRAAEVLQAVRPAGGQDNIAALVQAWDLAAGSTNGVVVWIHGPQPILLDNAEALRQRFERRPVSPALYEIQTSIGPNRIVEKLDGVAAVKAVARRGGLREDLDRLLETWSSTARTFDFVRERLDAGVSPDSMSGRQGSLHLARLWAFNEIPRLIAARQFAQALELAGRYQLVTPISGAVVLETKAQYQAAGLKAVDAATVPSVPEPSTWVLLGLGLLFGVVEARRRRACIKRNVSSN